MFTFVEVLIFCLSHLFVIDLLQVLEQLSGQTPVFSKGEIVVRVCSFCAYFVFFIRLLQFDRFTARI
jgi:hypothetical protein